MQSAQDPSPDTAREQEDARTVAVVLDCDPGVDDAMAIFYGLLAPHIDIVAIGTVWGNVEVEKTTQNALRLCEIVDRADVPVAMGAAKPLIGPVPMFALVHGEDGQGNTSLPPPKGRASGEAAAAQIVRLAHERPGELTLVAVGPLTNLAIALALDPAIASLYREVVIMGGSFLAPGNAARVAEANIWHDPEAAQVVLEAGWPVTLVGLDVTNRVRLTWAMLEELRDGGTPAGAHLHRITAFYMNAYAVHMGGRECPMHDALALAIAADPTLVPDAPRARVDVELDGRHTRGMTVADLRPWAPKEDRNAAVVLEVDGPRFLRHWMEVVGQRSPSP